MARSAKYDAPEGEACAAGNFSSSQDPAFPLSTFNTMFPFTSLTPKTSNCSVSIPHPVSRLN